MTTDLWDKLIEAHTLSDMIGQTEIKEQFIKYAKVGYIPNITIYGNPGCGKTLLMKCFGADLGYVKYDGDNQIDLVPGQFYILDSSKDRNIDYIRKVLKDIASNLTFIQKPRIIVLDEFNFTPDAQAAMLKSMQDYPQTRFVCITNDPSNIIPAILSRCPPIEMKPLKISDYQEVIKRIQKICEMTISHDALLYLYEQTEGDIRKFIKLLQNAYILNPNILLEHVKQESEVSQLTKKTIMETAYTDYIRARETIIVDFSKEKNYKVYLSQLYFEVMNCTFSSDPETNKICQTHIRNKIADIERLKTSNELLQLDSILNFISLLNYIPLTCPKVIK